MVASLLKLWVFCQYVRLLTDENTVRTELVNEDFGSSTGDSMVCQLSRQRTMAEKDDVDEKNHRYVFTFP